MGPGRLVRHNRDIFGMQFFGSKERFIGFGRVDDRGGKTHLVLAREAHARGA